MTKARREIADAMPSQDLVIEVLDARAPLATANPVLDELRSETPCLRVLNKSDLADADVTEAWLAHLTSQAQRGRVVAMAASTLKAGDVRARVERLSRALAPEKRPADRPIRAMIVGIPNVGKSSLINALMNRVVAKVGDKPAVTKAQQQVVLPWGMVLSDNPGILWPKIEDPDAAMRLALLGSIPDTAFELQIVAQFAARLLRARYADRLRARYKLDQLPEDPAALLDAIGRRRGCLRAGGVVDAHKAAEVLIHDARSGVLGRMTLETPG